MTPDAQSELNQAFEEWLKRQTPDTLPREVLDKADGSQEEFDEALAVAFLAEEFERVMADSDEFVCVHKPQADGTIKRQWWKRGQTPNP